MFSTKLIDIVQEIEMAKPTRSAGTNARPLHDTIAGTGPGIADDSRKPGDPLPEAPSGEDVARAAKALDAPVPERDRSPD